MAAVSPVRRIATVNDLRVGDVVFYLKREWKEAKIIRLIPPTKHCGKIIAPRAEVALTERGGADVYVVLREHLIPFCFVRRGVDNRSRPPTGNNREVHLKHAADLWSIAAQLCGVSCTT